MKHWMLHVLALVVLGAGTLTAKGELIQVDFAGNFNGATAHGSVLGIVRTTTFTGSLVYDSSTPQGDASTLAGGFAGSIKSFQATLNTPSGTVSIVADQFTGLYSAPNAVTWFPNTQYVEATTSSLTSDTLQSACTSTGANGSPQCYIGFWLSSLPGDHPFNGEGHVLPTMEIGQFNDPMWIGKSVFKIYINENAWVDNAPVTSISARIITPRCQADFNNDSAVNVSDIFAFLRAWFAHDTAADINADSAVNVTDIFAFLRLWFSKCP